MAMIDIQLLRIMRSREQYSRLRDVIPKAAVDKQTLAIIADMGKYFEEFSGHADVDLNVFIPFFKRRHPTLDDANYASYVGILKQISVPVDDDTREAILRSMFQLKLGTDLANMLETFNEGDLEDIASSVGGILDQYKLGCGVKDARWIDTDIGELLAQERDDAGLKFRLQCLRTSMRGLRPGDFGIVAARPDRGKTTFLSSEVTYMAPQLEPERNILWLNNEGPGGRIVPRLYQSALGVTSTELIQKYQRGHLETEYTDIVGRRDRIRVVDVHGMNTYQVESIIEANNAGVVLYDMLDNIRGFGDAPRTDLMLERMYQWGREIAVKYEAIGIATSQISAEGDGLQFPPQSALKDSKTGKQGACDFILMIGSSNEPSMAGLRYIGLPKNKLRRDGSPGDPRETVAFRADRARYDDIIETPAAEFDDSKDEG